MSADLAFAAAAVVLSSGGAGAVVAFLIRRVQPAIPFLRTWLYYALLFAFLTTTVLWVGMR